MIDKYDMELIDLEEEIYIEQDCKGYSFDDFISDYPTYLDSLNNCIKLLYNTYVLVHNKRFFTIKKNSECLEMANRCGFGMLLRHAMETIVTSIATENGVEVGGRSVYERLNALKGQNIPGYDKSRIDVLFDLLNITNEIAHPHVLSTQTADYAQMKYFYDTAFKEMLESHIWYVKEIIKYSKSHDFGITKEVSKSRKQTYNYLVSLKKQLDNLNIFANSTNILIQGCLVRQLTECSTNLWCYNCGIVPTDASTFENQISLGKVLSFLSKISKAEKSSAFGVSALTPQVINNLYDLKAASNSLMHVDKFAAGNLSELGKTLSDMYAVVKAECSPHVMKNKLNAAGSLNKAPRKRIREKSPVVAALLCGTLGWLGAHHFYLGKIAKGVMTIPFLGFIIGPTLDLLKIFKGRMRNSRGVRLKKTAPASITAFVLILCHLFIFYTLGMKLYKSDAIDKIKGYIGNVVITLEECDNSETDSLSKISVSGYASSSHLTTRTGQFSAALCIDSNPATCWQEGVAGIGEGESLTFGFATDEKIKAIAIFAGKHTNEKAFYDNARPQSIIVKIGEAEFRIELEDTMEKHTFCFNKAIDTKEISFMIETAYPGNVWEDLCISEIEFYKEN